MKHLHTYLFIIFIMLTGCMDEDWSDCPDDECNLILHFRYDDGKGEDVFLNHIYNVELMIFDENGAFVEWHPLDIYSLTSFQGAQLRLEPGTYNIMSWANVSGYSSRPDLHGQLLFDDLSLQHSWTEGIDPLYYAPDKRTITRLSNLEEYSVGVPNKGTNEHTLDFMCAHRTLDIYVKGFADSNNDQITQPIVEVSNIASSYTYHLSQGTSSKQIYKTAHYPTEGTESEMEWAQALFTVPHFDAQNNINIHVRNSSDNNIRASIDLEKELKDRGIEVKEGDGLYIKIEVKFQGNDVIISIPNWEENPVKPDFRPKP